MALPESTPKQARELRKVSGLTQTEFGELFGVKRLTVVRWQESGMPAMEYHHARMLYDDEYACQWIADQAKRRSLLRSVLLQRLRKAK